MTPSQPSQPQRSDCICTADGEHPECADHGYEAVIRRYGSALTEINDFAANEVDNEEATWIMERVEQAFTSPPHAGAKTGRESRDAQG